VEEHRRRQLLFAGHTSTSYTALGRLGENVRTQLLKISPYYDYYFFFVFFFGVFFFGGFFLPGPLCGMSLLLISRLPVLCDPNS